MTMKEFEAIWNRVGDMPRVSSNGYRIFLDLLLNGPATQSQLCTRNNWIKTSVSSAMSKLYEEKLVDCQLSNRRIEYFANVSELEIDENRDYTEIIDMKTFRKLWKIVSDKNEMSANLFRVYIDVLLYGSTTPKALWERRNWKITGVSESFRKLYDLGLLNYIEENGRKIYSAKLNLEEEE